jgi:hypothetical protein
VTRAPRALAAALALALGGCVSDAVVESAVTVLTLQGGTVSELRDRRGTGPFRTYDVPPAEMLGVIERAAGKARGLGGKPVTAIFVSERYREVIAKERTAEQASSDAYSDAFRTAVVAMVDPVPGKPGSSRVEIHAMHRGPFHRGSVAWERDLPTWIDEVLGERGRAPGRVLRIP